MKVEEKLEEMGLILPGPPKIPEDMRLLFAWVRVRGDRAHISGHGPLGADGSLSGPFGKVGAEVSPEEGYTAAPMAALSVLGSLRRDLGDRVSAWLVVHGLVDAAPGFGGTAGVISGFFDLILELYRPEAGMHARTAPGVATLPLDQAVIVAAEVEIHP